MSILDENKQFDTSHVATIPFKIERTTACEKGKAYDANAPKEDVLIIWIYKNNIGVIIDSRGVARVIRKAKRPADGSAIRYEFVGTKSHIAWTTVSNPKFESIARDVEQALPDLNAIW